MAPVSTARRATLIGIAAIAAWGAAPGLVRIVGESYGAALGTALYCTLGAALLWIVRRPRSLRALPSAYLWGAGALFVVYNVCFGLALGLARDATQALEISMVNFLWPTLMVVFTAVLPPRRTVGWTLAPGILLAVVGIGTVVGGEAGLSVHSIVENVTSSPLPYLLAMCSAISWTIYSTVGPRLAKGHDGITVFFTASAVGAWLVYAIIGGSAPDPLSPQAIISLTIGALLIGAGYACWNIGIGQGNLTLLASASYATPVLASGAGAVLLGATLGWPFWQGTALVTLGSMLSWWATREREHASPPEGRDTPNRATSHEQGV